MFIKTYHDVCVQPKKRRPSTQFYMYGMHMTYMKEKDIDRMQREAPENFYRDGEFTNESEARKFWRKQ